MDPITLELLQLRLVSLANAMEATLLRSAFSAIVKEGGDASASPFGAQGQTVSLALAVPMNLGSLATLVPAILKKGPAYSMNKGDVFIPNDPYEGGTPVHGRRRVVMST